MIGSTLVQSITARFAKLAATAGAALVGLDATVNYVAGTIGRTVVDRTVNPRDFPWLAKFDGATDDTAAITAALTWLGTAGGGVLECPRGTAICSSTLALPVKTILAGKGKHASILSFTNAGDGVKTTSPINSSTAVHSGVQNIGIVCTNGASTGGGYVDVGGTFIDLFNVYFSGWKYGTIFDQTEISTIERCEFTQGAGQVGLWLVNGADHTAGANPGYTNRIAVNLCQFNAAAGAAENVIDDGGANHVFSDNNLNAGSAAIRAAGIYGLRIEGNESEGHTGAPIYFTTTTKAGAYVGPCNGGCMSGGNTFSDATTYHVLVDDLTHFTIAENNTVQALSAFVGFSAASPAVGVVVERNSKLLIGANRSAATFIAAPSSQIVRNNRLLQAAHTFVAGAIASGAQAVTPATMEAIKAGTRLVVLNADGTQSESVQVTATTGTTFTATFANAHTANFIVRGVTHQDEEEGTWTPAVAGTTTAGANTYSTQVGSYVRRGNFVHAKFNIVVSVKDVGMAGALQITGLPFVAENMANQSGVCTIAGFTGLTFPASFTQLGGTVAPTTGVIALLRSGSTVAFFPPQASEAGATFTLIGEVTLYTGSV